MNVNIVQFKPWSIKKKKNSFLPLYSRVPHSFLCKNYVNPKDQFLFLFPCMFFLYIKLAGKQLKLKDN